MIGRPAASLLDAVGAIARRVAAERAAGRWPSPRWQSDPVGFAREVLGVQLWAFQVELLEAIRDHRHVTCAGGRKIGKDFAVGVAALWWFASFDDARVIALAPSAKQVDGIFYREVRILHARSGRCFDCRQRDPDGPRPCPHSAILDGNVGMLARTGVVAPDLREIRGTTAVNEGGLRGLSGARILAIEDEASDIKDEFDAALVGNLAGADCHRVLISNPTRTAGFFHRSHHEERDLFRVLQQSSEQNPNIVEGREVVRGLATREWIAERELAWGRGSPAWSANVDGQFVKAEEGQLFTLEAITASEQRWEDVPAEGRLVIGVDVAGENEDGDETAIAVRRGLKVLELFTRRGLSPSAILEVIRGTIHAHRRSRFDSGDDMPLVVLDRDGATGARVFDAVNAYRLRDETTEREFRLVGFRGSAPPAGRLSEVYRLSRDALFGGLLDWFREGGAIPIDMKLEGELVALRWVDAERGRSRLIHKSDLRARLGRSPDRLDAVALSTHGERLRPPTFATDAAVQAREVPEVYAEESGGGIDPYGGSAFDPYGGLFGGYSR